MNCPFYLLYAAFFATLFACHVLGFLLCAMVGDNKTGSKYGYSIMLISIFYQIFFSNKMFLQLIYTQDLPWAIVGLYYFMYINPSFHFANVIVSIITVAGNHYNNSTAMWVKGEDYTWDMFKTHTPGQLFGRNFDLPSPLDSMFSILKVTGFLLLFVYICDNLVASNRGYSRNPFPIGRLFKRKGEDQDMLVVREQLEGEAAGDRLNADGGREIIVEDEKCLNGVVMKDLWKSYIASCSRKDSNKKDWALRDINLQIRQGELLALLGPNGAGKTTMIGIMSGILEPTRGTFFSNGLNSKTDQSQIRSITNVCPQFGNHAHTAPQIQRNEFGYHLQFDILWDELTVEDHIRMVCRIKGVAESEVPKMAEALLAIVNLPDSLKNKIGNLSGGMKRRISIALALSIYECNANLLYVPPNHKQVPDLYSMICCHLGVREGAGTLITPTGSIYEGFWVGDQGVGKVRIFYNDGHVYVGEWANNKPHGQGQMTNPVGDIYVGAFVSGARSGRGTLTTASGDKYEGDFSNDQFEGQGEMTWKEGRQYAGTWKANRIHGKGTYTWADGRKYVGDYNYEVKEGYGEFYWPDGKAFKGSWVNGKQDGKGEFIDPSGKARKGVWAAGKIVKWDD